MSLDHVVLGLLGTNPGLGWNHHILVARRNHCWVVESSCLTVDSYRMMRSQEVVVEVHERNQPYQVVEESNLGAEGEMGSDNSVVEGHAIVDCCAIHDIDWKRHS